MEVSESLLKHLLKAFGKYPNVYYVDDLRRQMQEQIAGCDESGLAQSLEAMVATVPYDLHIEHEHYYHSLLLLWLRLLGFQVQGEEHNHRGRTDIVWELPELTVIAEVKYDEKTAIEALLNKAMKQIHERQYYSRYLGKVLLLGIAFSGKQPGCKMELRTKN
jgi:hypothetical protein